MNSNSLYAEIFKYMDLMKINPDDNFLGYRTLRTLEMRCLSYINGVTKCTTVSDQYYYCHQLSWIFCVPCWDSNIVDKVFTTENGEKNKERENRYIKGENEYVICENGISIGRKYVCNICYTFLRGKKYYSNGCSAYICIDCYPDIRQKFKFIENCHDYLESSCYHINTSYLYIKPGLEKKIPKKLEDKISIKNAKLWEEQLKTIGQVPSDFGSARQWLMLDGEMPKYKNIHDKAMVGVLVDCDSKTNGRIAIIYRTHQAPFPEKKFLVIIIVHDSVSDYLDYIKNAKKNMDKVKKAPIYPNNH